MATQVAVLGTGLMGAPMARRLIAGGFDVHVWNRSPEKAEAVAADGATAHRDPAEAAAGADFIITMLSDGEAVADVLFERGVAARIRRGATVIDMSSIKPTEAREHAERLAEREIHHLDAPVSGGTKGAEAGTLAIMAGGDSAVFEAARPVLSAMGRPVLVGGSGAGQLSKLANQAIVAVTIGVVAEATLLMRQGEADLSSFRNALTGGFADSTILQQHGKRMAERDFKPGGPSRLQLKDLDNLLEEARSLGLELPLVRAARDRFETLVHKMDGSELDHSALFLELEAENGFQR
jgi:2-hydroxy-3-oxopropionate reductase